MYLYAIKDKPNFVATHLETLTISETTLFSSGIFSSKSRNRGNYYDLDVQLPAKS
jgi:hypothetical protein